MTGYQAANVATGAASVGSGLIGSVLNYFSQKQTNRANAALAKQQNDWNVEQWNRENEYNSPANQLQLIRDAGLNPNQYEQGSATANNVSSADLANQQAPQLDLQGPMSSGLQALQQAAQAEELRAQIKESYQRQRFAEGLYPYQIEAANIANGLAGDQRDIAKWETNLMRLQYVNDQQTLPLQRAVMRAGIDQTRQSIEESKQNIKSSQQGITESQQRIKQAWRDLALKAHLQEWQIKQMQTDMANVSANTNLLMFRVNMAKKYHIDPNLPALNNLITLSLADPDQFSAVGQRLSDNFKTLFQGAGSASTGLSGAWQRFMGQSWYNPSSNHGAGRRF